MFKNASIRNIAIELDKQCLIFSTGVLTEVNNGGNVKPSKKFNFKNGWQKKTKNDFTTIKNTDNAIILHTGTPNNIIAIDWDLYDWNGDEFVLNDDKFTAYNEITSKYAINTFIERSGNRGVHWIYKYDPTKLSIKGGKLVFKRNLLNCGDLKINSGCVFFTGTQYMGINNELKKYESDNTTMEINDIPIEILNYFTYDTNDNNKQHQHINSIKVPEKTDTTSDTPNILFNSKDEIINELGFLKICLSCLDYNNYETWIDVLHSVKHNTEYYNIVHLWSAQSHKYVYNDTQKIIDNGNGEKTIGSIIYRAKHDTHINKFNSLMGAINIKQDTINLLYNFSDLDIANFFYKNHKDNYFYDSTGKIESWFICDDNNLWTRIYKDDPLSLLYNIILYFKNVVKYVQMVIKTKIKITDITDPMYKTYTDLNKNLILYVKATSDVRTYSGTMIILKHLYTNTNITTKIIKQSHNINKFTFLNGYINLTDMTFNKIEKTDYITTNTGYKYNATPHKINFVMDILDKMGEPTHIKYILNIISKCMFGQNTDRRFYVFTGSGANGKSVITDDFIKNSFGQYYKSIRADYFTTSSKAGNATPELADKEYCRILIGSEPEACELLQTAKIKKITGMEEIQTRALYKDEKEWVPQFTPILLCNDIPDFTKIDAAITQRIKIVPFNNKFVDTPITANERKRDPYLKKLINDDNDDQIKQSFIQILLNNYKYELTNNDIHETNTATTNFIETQNPVITFIKAKLIRTNATAFIISSDMYSAYKEFYLSDDNNPINELLSVRKFMISMQYNDFIVETKTGNKKYYKNVVFIVSDDV